MYNSRLIAKLLQKFKFPLWISSLSSVGLENQRNIMQKFRTLVYWVVFHKIHCLFSVFVNERQKSFPVFQTQSFRIKCMMTIKQVRTDNGIKTLKNSIISPSETKHEVNHLYCREYIFFQDQLDIFVCAARQTAK